MGALYNLGEIDGINITELFNGTANDTSVIYNLNDSIKNYKMILVLFGTGSVESSCYNKNAKMIFVDDIEIGSNTNEFRIYQNNGSTNYYTVQFYFPDFDKLKISEVKRGGQWTNSRIYKIVGIN